MKKIYFVITAICCSLCMLADGVEVNGIHYLFTGSNATVTYTGTIYHENNTYSSIVEIPSTVDYNGSTYKVNAIGYGAFCNCEHLITVIIPNTILSIGVAAFSTSNIKYITIPSSVMTIDEDAFHSCVGLKEVNLEEGTKWLEAGVFAYCINLKNIVLPSTISSLGESCFEDCTGLTSLECRAITPPDCEKYVFDAVNKQIPVYVPAESLSAYKSATGWKEFTNIQAINTAIDNMSSIYVENNKIYNLIGQTVDANYRGVLIKNGQKYLRTY